MPAGSCGSQLINKQNVITQFYYTVITQNEYENKQHFGLFTSGLKLNQHMKGHSTTQGYTIFTLKRMMQTGLAMKQVLFV